MPRTWFEHGKLNPQARCRLFCFPFAGSGASIFYTWSDHFPPTVEIFPVELPGHGTRLKEATTTQLSVLVQGLTDVIHPYLDRPFALFGHSMGALISFELARQLRREHALLPDYLFVSAHRAPQLADFDGHLHTLSDQDLLEQLVSLNGTPRAILEEPELMSLILPIIRADFALIETYTYQPESPLTCPIAAFGGLQDAIVSQSQVEAWHEQTVNAFALHLLPGDHFFLSSAKPIIARLITQKLLQVGNLGI